MARQSYLSSKTSRDRGGRGNVSNPMVVTSIQKLLAEVSMEQLLRFLHRLRVRFTLTTTDTGQYCCRVFKQYKQDGEIVTMQEYKRGGKSPQSALLNAIAVFLACEEGDYHDFINDDWCGKSGSQSTGGNCKWVD